MRAGAASTAQALRMGLVWCGAARRSLRGRPVVQAASARRARGSRPYDEVVTLDGIRLVSLPAVWRRQSS